MAKRKRIGLVFSYDEGWIAGAYYIMNLVHALKTLPDSQKPFLVILSTTEEELSKIREINYPYISYKNLSIGTVHYNLYERIINKLWRVFKGHNVIEKKFRAHQIDYLFPAYNHPFLSEVESHKRIFWIPDFQEDYLPHFFSEKEVIERKAYQLYLSEQTNPIIFSSRDALNDFQRLYPMAKNIVSVLNFAVTNPVYNSLDIDQLKQKFQIDKPYFFSPNQFWQHKNHSIILKAITLLKDRKDILVVFTGKEQDYRNPLYFDGLKSFLKDNNIEDKVRFLGFIDRKEQLQLMKHSLAVIQSSLFEGWSTVVEDAKAMNQFVILSDLKVHREQLDKNVAFFDPNSPENLANCMKNILEEGLKKQDHDYNANIKTFANAFFKLINS